MNLQGVPEAILLRLRGIVQQERSSWHLRLLMHEVLRPWPAAARIRERVMKPVAERLAQLLGSILNLPPDNPTTQLCLNSLAGQVLFYVLRATSLGQLVGGATTTEAECESVADHLTLAYLRQVGQANSPGS